MIWFRKTGAKVAHLYSPGRKAKALCCAKLPEPQNLEPEAGAARCACCLARFEPARAVPQEAQHV